MSATTDPVYIAALQTLNRVTPLAVFDVNTPLGSAYWQLSNHMQVARGDAQLGGSDISAATRAAVLDASGNLQPGIKPLITGWTNALNAAYPAVVVAGNGGSTEPFLGGILDGEIFGIPKKLIVVGALAYFFLGK